ncbi:MAG: GNAT family N-acetyltransferase [Alphaproteobacteria bacterium]|nr:GNAT family N-acetyltransferase [Alphaproteobacteria bacterium]
MQQRYDIKYKPLFNQEEPGIWDSFAEVEMDSRTGEGYTFKNGDLNDILDNYRKDWQESNNNIAFGAFLNGNLVGFAKGFMIEAPDYKLSSLFVRHDMKRQGIGRKLITHFENSVALVGSYVQGQCYEWAIPFYQKQGYTVVHGKAPGPEMSKKLSKLGKGVYPMFSRWKVKDIRPKICSVPVDRKLLNDSLYQPLFVSVNENAEIDVVGLKNKDGVDTVWVSEKIPESIKKCREMLVRYQLSTVNLRSK